MQQFLTRADAPSMQLLPSSSEMPTLDSASVGWRLVNSHISHNFRWVLHLHLLLAGFDRSCRWHAVEGKTGGRLSTTEPSNTHRENVGKEKGLVINSMCMEVFLFQSFRTIYKPWAISRKGNHSWNAPGELCVQGR